MMNIEKKRRIIRSLITFGVLLLLIGGLLGLYYGLGFNELIEDPEDLRAEIDSYGNNSRLIYILIQLIQTTILPISNVATIIVGRVLYGKFQAALLTSIGVLIGSVISFGIAKFFGKKAIYWIVGKEQTDKYLNLLKGKANLVIFVMLLLPFFPDDIICFVAGLTPMSWLFFLFTILMTRPLPIFLTSFFIDTQFIPFSGWGLAIWGGILLIFAVSAFIIKKRWAYVNSFLDRMNDFFERSKNPKPPKA